MTLNVRDLPLSQAAEELRTRLGQNVLVDRGGLLEAGVAPEQPVTWTIADRPSTDALNELLAPLGLAWQVDQQVIVISSPDRCAGPYRTVVYSVRHLIDDESDANSRFRNLAEAAQAVRAAVGDESSWSNQGGPGAMRMDGATSTLLIRQSRENHRAIREYLAR